MTLGNYHGVAPRLSPCHGIGVEVDRPGDRLGAVLGVACLPIYPQRATRAATRPSLGVVLRGLLGLARYKRLQGHRTSAGEARTPLPEHSGLLGQGSSSGYCSRRSLRLGAGDEKITANWARLSTVRGRLSGFRAGRGKPNNRVMNRKVTERLVDVALTGSLESGCDFALPLDATKSPVI
jgi:hypothetical protein